MDNSWDWVEEELKKIQTDLPVDNDMMQVVDAISVADFWKRRYDEESMHWEKKLSAKEDEKKALETQSVSHEISIKELDWKLKELERRWDQEKLLLEDRLRTKEVEAALEKTKLEMNSRMKTLEEENKNLKSELGTASGVSVSVETKPSQELTPDMPGDWREMLKKSEEESKTRLEKLKAEKENVHKELESKETLFTEERKKWQNLEGEVSQMQSQMSQRLSSLKEREDEHFTILEDLARGFAHRVRNYLGIMSGTIQLCVANYKMEEDLKEQLEIVDNNVQEMLKSIEEFLSFARVPEMASQDLNINDVLLNSFKPMEMAFVSQKVEVTKKLDPNLPVFKGDQKLFEGAFSSLIKNALEAMPDGGNLGLSTLFDKTKNIIVINIEDNGKGISENHIKKVFQPYFSSKKNHRGLGLTGAKRVIDLHRGTLTLTSKKNSGTKAAANLILEN